MTANMIFIESGQCGNQVGFEIIQTLFGYLTSESLPESEKLDIELYFRQSSRSKKLYSRSICLDTEPKVIHDCISKSKNSSSWLIDPKSVAYRHGGAGNNWALGYQMCSGEFLETAIDLVRREVEFCDCNPVLLSVHSMAGGTGSGLGARMTEALQDSFGDLTRANLAILPYHFGEVVVQNYNALLSLSKISSASDAILMFENEVAQDLCKRMRGIDRPSLADINKTIASNISPIFLPKHDRSRLVSSTYRSCFDDDIIHLCSHPGYRLLDVKFVPQTSDASIDFTFDFWPTLIRSLLRMQILGVWSELGISKMLSREEEMSVVNRSPIDASMSTASSIQYNTSRSSCASLGAVLTLRGLNSGEASQQQYQPLQDSWEYSSAKSMSSQSISRKAFQDNESFPKNYFASLLEDPLRVSYSRHICNNYQRSASLLANSQAILPIIQRSTFTAKGLFIENAYIHLYEKYGVEKNDFIQAFQNIGQVIENYKALG